MNLTTFRAYHFIATFEPKIAQQLDTRTDNDKDEIKWSINKYFFIKNIARQQKS
jgi:hypothetical protein